MGGETLNSLFIIWGFLVAAPLFTPPWELRGQTPN
jgi:hypothetical protein